VRSPDLAVGSSFGMKSEKSLWRLAADAVYDRPYFWMIDVADRVAVQSLGDIDRRSSFVGEYSWVQPYSYRDSLSMLL
jgi:hypothetical protein